ncbi:hypothetical protein GCM10008929_03010 [Alkalibacterium psychrotolerans]
MKEIVKTRSRFKNLIYSSAVLAALSPSVEAQAQESGPVDTSVSIDILETDSHGTLFKELLESSTELVNQDVSLLHLMVTTRELHLEENFELASKLYSYLSNYPEFDEVILEQIHINEALAVDFTEPVEWTLTDNQKTKYETIIVLRKNQINYLLNDAVDKEAENDLHEENVKSTNEASEDNDEMSIVETEEQAVQITNDADETADINKAETDENEETLNDSQEPEFTEMTNIQVSEENNVEEDVNFLTTSNSNEADKLYEKSIQSESVTTSWYTALEGYNLYPDDARFKDAIERAGVRSLNYADRLEERGDLQSALAYFNRTLSSPWLSDTLTARAQTSKERVEERIATNDEARKQTLYNESVQSGSVTTAWNKALEGYNLYPDDARFKDAIERAGVRSLNYADRLEERGDLQSALAYFNRTLSSPWLSDTLTARAQTSIASVRKAIEEKDKENLYNTSINSPYVTESWNKAMEGYSKYPNDSRFQDAIRRAAVRNLNYADSLKSSGRAQSSIQYYDRILNSPWIPNDLYTRAYNTKEEIMKYLDSDYVYQEILKEKNQIIAWEMATKAFVDHPQDNRISDYIIKQAEVILSDAISLHKDYQYDRAIQRYDLLINGPTDIYDNEEVAQKYKILAMNKLIPNHATYQNSYYHASLDEALDEQMRRAPQTQSGGRWVNATRAQTEYYLNPENFLKSIDTSTEFSKITGKVTASALNVRSGSGTSHSAIDMIYNGKEVTIINEANGWYEIIYTVSGENRKGWVSGAFVEKDTKESVRHDFNDAYTPVGRITAATLNVRQGPGTVHSIITTVNSGQRYTILKVENGWYQIDLGNGQYGWVSGDFVTVSNTLDKNLLQFLKLSGSSGIDEARLNQEIGNSGVLTGKGHVFLEASQRYNINEIYLLAHAKLETGNGSSALAKGILVSEVDGKPVTPKVVYNMYGIAAFDNSPLKSGSEYAYKMGWDTVDKAILGGAEWISNQYVNHPTHKQDTLYKMRWNPLNPGVHQYATDIGWAYKQTHTLNTLVEISQRYNLHLNFDIPVYNQK